MSVPITHRVYSFWWGFILSGWYFIGPVQRYDPYKEKRPVYPICKRIPDILIKPVYRILEMYRKIKYKT